MFTLRYQGGDPVLAGDGKDWSCQHAQTARATGVATAKITERAIEVMRGARVAYIIQPDGTVRPPTGAIEPPHMNCTAGTGRACFCQPCRDERKAARR